MRVMLLISDLSLTRVARRACSARRKKGARKCDAQAGVRHLVRRLRKAARGVEMRLRKAARKVARKTARKVVPVQAARQRSRLRARERVGSRTLRLRLFGRGRFPRL